MQIMRAIPNSGGAYPPIQSWTEGTPPDGYHQVSDTCDTSAMQTHMGFVTLTIDDGVVSKITGDDAAYQAYLASLPTPAAPEPTVEEKNRADIDYIAVMAGVTL